MRADESTGNAVLSLELIEGAADVSPVARVGRAEGICAGVDGRVGKPADRGPDVAGIPVGGLTVYRERPNGGGEGGGREISPVRCFPVGADAPDEAPRSYFGNLVLDDVDDAAVGSGRVQQRAGSADDFQAFRVEVSTVTA